MGNQKISWDIKIDGTLLSAPSELHMGAKNGQFELQGVLQTSQMKLTKVIESIDKKAAEQYGAYLDRLTGLFPEQTGFRYTSERCVIWLRGNAQRFGILWQKQDFAVLYAITLDEGTAEEGFEKNLALAAKTLGIEKMLLALKKGTACTYSQLSAYVNGGEEEFRIPARLQGRELLFCGDFAFDKQTVTGQAMKALFGIGELKLRMFFTAAQQGFGGYALLPVLEGSALKAEELCFGIEIEKKSARFLLAGTFTFPFLEGFLFTVSCRLENKGFMIEAFAKTERPRHLFHTFSIGDTCLAIGYQKGFVFQMFSNLYMGKIKLFGAVGLSVTGGTASLNLLSAAVTDITLPVFVESILGKKINGLETFDFLNILGLPLQKADVPAMGTDGIYAEPFNGGTILIDKKRMRHYFVSADGKTQLQAQFYYAAKNMELGDYTVSSGIFLCGTLKLFQKVEFQALFALSEKDGVTAYACIRNLNLGFLKLSESGFNTPSDHPLTKLPAKNILRQFVNPEEKGAVFYLRAGVNEVSFYIDAKVEFLGLFRFAARILYTKGQISLDAAFALLGGIKAALHIGVFYRDFSNSQFSFFLEIDCTGLEEKLKRVQEKINGAIEKLKQKINGAKAKLTQAQNHVNELYGQITGLDRKIQNCKSDIKNAKWYKKAFVAIAKGIEIAAYEVAKAGLYVAIGVAKAALEVAKQIVALGGIVGEGVLRAVNGAITATLNLFFIRLIRLQSSVSAREQYFQAQIEFVALGKTYRYQTTLGKKALAENPAGALSDNMNERMNSDLEDIEKGTFRSNRNRYRHEEYTIAQHKTRLKEGMKQLNSSTELMCRMQDIYVDGCGETMPEFEEMNLSYNRAVSEIGGMLELTGRSVDFESMDRAVSMMEEELAQKEEAVRDAAFIPVKEALTEYRDARELLAMAGEGLVQVEGHSRTIQEHDREMKKKEENYQKEYIESGKKPDCNLVSVLNDTETAMYEAFPVTRNRKDFINLSRETKIQQYFDEAREEFGGEGTEKIKNMRTRAAKGRYENRL